jgi:hypothetical protein
VVSSRVVAWATGTAVVLGGVQALAINKVDAGAGWRIAAVVCTVLAAVLAGWLAYRAYQPPSGPEPERPVVQGLGSVLVGRGGKVGGSVRIRAAGVDAYTPVPPAGGQDADVVGTAAVRVDGEVGQDVSSHVTGTSGAAGTGPVSGP